MKEAQNWVLHLQHLQSILAKFDIIKAPNESTMIHYFWEDLKPSLKNEIKQQNRVLTSFKEMIQRAVNAKAKADLRLSIMIRDAVSHCSRSHCPSQKTSAKVQTQSSTAKESKPKEFRPKDLKPANGKTPALLCTNKSGKISRQDNKKEYFKKKRDRKNSILATENNAIEGEKKWNNWGHGKYYNCQKKRYFARNCLEPSKNKCLS